MTKAEMRKTVESFVRAWNDHDVDAVVEHAAPGVLWTNPATGGAIQGREAAKADVRATFAAFPDLHFPMEDFRVYTTDEPDVAFSTWTITGTMTGPLMGFAPTGREVRFRGVCMYKFLGGQFAEHAIVFDGLDFAQQLGLLPREQTLAYKALTALENVTMQAMKLVRR
jgi:steroid delta-isomerase-like uncharacterized protein